MDTLWYVLVTTLSPVGVLKQIETLLLKIGSYDSLRSDSVDLIREGFFWFPSARPSILRGSKVATFFLDGRYLNSTFLSGRFCEQHGCTAKYMYSYGARLSEVYVSMYCAPVYTST